MGFINDLIVRRDTAEDHAWILVEDVSYKNSTMTITIKRGFLFDFASTPQTPIMSWLFPKSGTATDRPSLLHDALYAGEIFEREICDALFLEAMQSDGVSYFKRYAMYWAVRSFGWTVWKNHEQEEVNAYKKFVYCEPTTIL